MSDYFLGQIMLSGFNFAPRNFAQCNGQLIPVNQNQALFSLLGTIYGGNGVSNFQLPDLRGRTPVGFGSSSDPSWQPSPYAIGSVFGVEAVTLTAGSLPQHTHAINATTAPGKGRDAPNAIYGAPPNEQIYANANSGATLLNSLQMQNAGGNQPHPNMQPFNVLNFSICTSGMYPSRG
jgi:microcystin-dependent protein